LSTISDVARQAGVSIVTVSRVLNNAPNVNYATRNRVEQAIQELGYVPNVVARSLRSKRTRSLALILPDITNPFWTTVARGVEDAAQNSGYSVLLCNTDENCAKQLRYLDLVASRRVDGVIIAPFDSDVENIRALRDREIATVLVDRRIAGWETDSVRGDSMGGARALVQHLIGLGHTRIAMISGPANTSTARDRVDGYLSALMEAGIRPDPALIRQGEFRARSGERLMEQVLDDDSRSTAVFAANNAIAMGAIDAVVRRGRRIPHDLALVCFDDFDAASHLFPFLTVAVQPAYEMGVKAAELLLSRIESDVALAPRQIVLPARLIIRHSCGSHLRDLDAGCSALALPLAGVSAARNVLIELAPDRALQFREGAVV
jgi:LacI family transcriptional regulator, galactose operon repressor